MGSQNSNVTLDANLVAVTSGNAVFVFLVGLVGTTSEITYYIQDGSGQPWGGPFSLGNPAANGDITNIAASVDAQGGIILIATIYYQGGVANEGNFYANYLPQALNTPWDGWTQLPNLPIPNPFPAIMMEPTWADGALYLILSSWSAVSIYYLRYGAPLGIHPPGNRQPVWATAYGTVAGPSAASGFPTWATDMLEVPQPNTTGPLTTSVFFVDTQSSLWMVPFQLSKPIGLNPPALVPTAPVQIDSATSGYGSLVATLLPNLAVTSNASGRWEVFCHQPGQCRRWTQSPPS
jgi:hypothetical protein